MATPGVTAATLIAMLTDAMERHGDDLEVAIAVTVSGQPLRQDLKAVAPDRGVRRGDDGPAPEGAPLLWLIADMPPGDVSLLAPRHACTPRVDVE